MIKELINHWREAILFSKIMTVIWFSSPLWVVGVAYLLDRCLEDYIE
ncbi:hypothetical protein [Thermosipho sp. (in: thermotogales)]|jgi:hypothetical protein|nr:hypothetical protein [Thermosipho sp. (in: thermotogales)]MBZ4649219.1 hypothetical protein [Thermosipho sp. (in: thermotogales)]